MVTPINIDAVVDTYTTLTNTGVKFKIPANHIYCVSATARYNASPPKGIAIKKFIGNTEDNSYFSAQNDSESDRVSVSISGYTTETVEFSVMTRYTNAGKNRILVSGFCMGPQSQIMD